MADYAPLRVLQILNHMDYGGIEAVVMNYYRFIDRSKVQFDFAVSIDSSLPQREEIEGLGGRVYLLPGISHLGRYIFTLKDIIQKNHYAIVHCHMNSLSVFPLFSAYLAGVKVRICHNHTTAHLGEGMRTAAKYALRPFCKWFATDYFACGEYAGRWMYGDKCFNAGKVYVMRNAIDIEKFGFDPAEREQIRKELGLAGKFVIGHIGRFMYQKNHDFLVDVFYEVYQRRKDAVLLLIGEGELLGQVTEKVKGMGIGDAVIFYGSCRNTEKLYHAMDVFCLPSFYEGVPVVAIEAQGNGLPVFFSDKVSQEARVLDGCEEIPLKMPAGIWAVRMLKCMADGMDRKKKGFLMEQAGYSIGVETGKIEKYYKNKFKIQGKKCGKNKD
ncbi:MAG: glycosyltransferase family 1 protein [Eubacterium sp.]|jgi:glycosyltransferase involved in cell wall biosynthesis|nr:glycosyltransferase family 1 protein [Eubacterium sp.]